MKTKQQPRANRLPHTLAQLIALSCMACLSTGCIAAKSYVDPQFRTASYMNIEPVAKPKPLVVESTFQSNGKESKQLRQAVRSRVTKVLHGSKLFYEADAAEKAQAAHLKIVVNNVGDVGAAFGKGFATGLTFGIVGSKVVDGYVMTATYTAPAGTPATKTYKHAIHTTVGLKSAPAGMERVPLQVAFDQVVEDMLLNFLRDMQKENAL
jgi:hypothetical protein